MVEIDDSSVHLIVTSPPYWHIKDYGTASQIGYGQSLHKYLKDLYLVWKECFRVLKPGRRLVINIGDQFTRAKEYGRYKIIPLHAEIISQCEQIGFDYMGSIIWQKKTTMNTSGGANVMGSYPYPPNGMIEIDYEYILIFKKLGKPEKVDKNIKESSKLTIEEWKEYFYGHWYFGGVRQIGHEAMFPEELPRRIIKMYSFIGETVLDPFLGSGTTIKVALDHLRNGIGYEINEDFLKVIKNKLGHNLLRYQQQVEIIKRRELPKIDATSDYKPVIKDALPIISEKEDQSSETSKELPLYKVIEILDDGKIKLDSGLVVKFLGVKIENLDESRKYLTKYVLRKKVFLKFDPNYKGHEEDDVVEAFVYLKNKIFINAMLIKMKHARPDLTKDHAMKDKFLKLSSTDVEIKE